jgi:hypothetical protein
VAYVTDIEGNYNYWNRMLSISTILVVEHVAPSRPTSASSAVYSKPYRLRFVDETSQFVYGGDVCDRGDGDLRFLTDLIQLKNDYPDRVHFIMGNR